ncbi:MAG TPA: DUF1553 domain-containing protein, partial [Pirellulaceae bacterium]|nr:DUF1553 domain-containing protein [Pirellulaceae bacterium]
RSQNNPDFQMDVVAEQIEVTTSGFMGLTVACARCHDHKFDPIPTTEYYALAGVFTSTQALYSGGGGRGNGRMANTGFHQLTGGGAAAAEREKRERELSASRESLASLIKELTDAGAFGSTLAESNAESASKSETDSSGARTSSGAAPSVDTSKLTKKQLAALEKRLAEKSQAAAKTKAKQAKLVAKQTAKADAKKQAELDADPVAKLKTARVPEGAPAALKKQIESLIAKGETAAGRIESLEAALKAPSELLAMGVRDAKKPADCALCIRGESQKRGDVIPRAFVSVVTNGSTKIETDGSGRLELARWIASSENPLTARVIVNRVWQHLFGRGIVPSVDNFGALGEKPSHPELLDHLALQFVADGWSIKRLIRSLVLTRTYGLSSDHDTAAYEKDPDNVLQWRHAPRRLEGEVLRDAMLAVSGHLSLERPVGSPIAKLGEETINDAKRKGDQFVDGSARCRSVYLPAVRNRLPEVLDLFDAPDPSLLVGLRDVTTVPAQSLFLMNSPLVIEQSRKFAQRVIASSEKPADRVRQAFRIALGRDATTTEVDRCLALLDKVRAKIKAETKASDDAELRGWSAICQSLYASAEFRYVE